MNAPVSADQRFVLHFEDRDVPPEFFSGHGAEEAARKRFDQAGMGWSCHLYVEVSDSTVPKSTSNPRALIENLVGYVTATSDRIGFAKALQGIEAALQRSGQ